MKICYKILSPKHNIHNQHNILQKIQKRVNLIINLNKINFLIIVFSKKKDHNTLFIILILLIKKINCQVVIIVIMDNFSQKLYINKTH